jgi:hypothetical protein
MIHAPVSTAEEQHALGALRTRRAAMLLVASIIMIGALLLVLTAYRSMDRTARRMDTVVYTR